VNYTIVLAADAVSTGEAVTFWIVGPIALAGALGMVFSRNAVHSALWLVLTMLGLGVFYFVQQGPFLGAVQIIVYTGAIMILFLFVLMLVGRESSDSVVETLRGQRQAAIVAGVAFAALVGAGIGRAVSGAPVQGLAEVNGNGGNVVAIAEILFTDYLFAFELTSALLITAAVGAMVLAHIEREPGERRTQKDLATARYAGPRPGTLPGPGVFATSNAVDTPAMLPDGRVAADSYATGVEMRPLPPAPDLVDEEASHEPPTKFGWQAR
jgi:NADH-quinone oxidoreductase subunit J